MADLHVSSVRWSIKPFSQLNDSRLLRQMKVKAPSLLARSTRRTAPLQGGSSLELISSYQSPIIPGRKETNSCAVQLKEQQLTQLKRQRLAPRQGRKPRLQKKVLLREMSKEGGKGAIGWFALISFVLFFILLFCFLFSSFLPPPY